MSSGHNISIRAEDRPNLSGEGIRKLREAGRIPGIVYGSEIGSLTLHVDEKELHHAARTGRSEFFQLALPDGRQLPVLIKDIQKSKGKVVHVDFQQVSKNKPLRVKIPLHFNGTAEGVKEGGILQTLETELEVEGLPDHLPSGIDIDVSSLNVGDKLTAAEITLPIGVTLHAAEDLLLASIVLPRAAVAVEDSSENAEPAGEAGKEPSAE